MINGIPEDIVRLVLASCERPLTQEERNCVDRWLCEHPEEEVCVRRLRQYAATERKIRRFESINILKGWRRVEAQTKSAAGWRLRRRRSIYRWSAAVVAVVLCAVVGVWYGQYQRIGQEETRLAENVILPGTQKAVWVLSDGRQIELEQDERHALKRGDGSVLGVDSSNVLFVRAEESVERTSLRVPQGGEYRVVLADGTSVWVNSESELVFPLRFEGEERIVELKGEAYFEVAKDAARPFLVRTSRSTVRVLGTSFNVCSYEDERQEQTTLVSGAVEVDCQGGRYRLNPGEQLAVGTDGGKPEIRKVKTRLYTSWKDGVFRFADMPLDELTVKLARWYDVRFEFVDEECKKSRFSGTIRKDFDFYRFMEMIETTTHVEFDIRGNNVLIKKKR